MAATTTLKLPASLKARIAPLAEAAGKTAQAWMIDALEAQAALVEMREAFVVEAEAAAQWTPAARCMPPRTYTRTSSRVRRARARHGRSRCDALASVSVSYRA
jgi:predicted transcriptional regulator